MPEKAPGDGLAIAAMVLGIIGLFCCGSIFSILSIVFGFVARSKGTTKDGMALAGIILGFIGFAIWLITFIISLATGNWLMELFDSPSYYYSYY